MPMANYRHVYMNNKSAILIQMKKPPIYEEHKKENSI